MKHYYFYTLKALWDSQGKALGCIMGCPGLRSSYQEKGLLWRNLLEFILRNFLSPYDIELPLLIPYYLSYLVGCMHLLICIDLYLFI